MDMTSYIIGRKSAGGGSDITIDDVIAITGELDNLNTTDKSNLVSAINEVASSGGGGSDLPIYTLETNREIWESNRNITASNDANAIEQASEIINKMYNSTKKYGGVLFYSTATKYQYLFLLNGSIETSQTVFRFYSNSSAYYMNENDKMFVYKQLLIGGTWDNEVFTCTQIQYSVPSYYNISNFLTKNNTNAYNPTPNSYNPATTKYVDDSIAAAITTTLGGSY